MSKFSVRCKAGDLVEVRSADEIFATLDDNGCLDALPFMPEMLQYCGQRFRVASSAHKTCDSTYYKDARRMQDAVFLENLRCDGSGHDGCEARCLIFFKLAWLKPEDPARDWSDLYRSPTPGAQRNTQWLAQTVRLPSNDNTPTYRCQATQHLAATVPMGWFDVPAFVQDIRSRNATVRHMVRTLALLLVWRLRFVGFGWRAALVLYERLHRFIYGARSPHIQGVIPDGQPTPAVALGVQPGEAVRVLSLDEIKATLNTANRNRGLSFNPEMAPFCEGTFKVAQRVRRIVDEKNGKMLDMKGPCITLENVYCVARYHPEAPLCPRRIPPYWREAWLTRVDQRAQPK